MSCFNLGLEKAGEAYISKSGKAVMVRFDDPSSVFSKYLCVSRVQLQRVLNNQQHSARVSLVTARQRVEAAAKNPDL